MNAGDRVKLTDRGLFHLKAEMNKLKQKRFTKSTRATFVKENRDGTIKLKCDGYSIFENFAPEFWESAE